MTTCLTTYGFSRFYALGIAGFSRKIKIPFGLVDENKDIDEIIAAVKAEKGVDIDEAAAKEIARARGVTYSRGMEHIAYITKNSPKKDIASLFLRMMSSDDFGETFSRTANGTSPYCAKENTTSPYKFVRNASKIPSNQYFSLVSQFSSLKGYRGEIGGKLLNMFTTHSHIPDYITAESTASMYTEDGTRNGKTESVYTEAAEKFLAAEKANVVKNWEDYLKNAGL